MVTKIFVVDKFQTFISEIENFRRSHLFPDILRGFNSRSRQNRFFAKVNFVDFRGFDQNT